MLLSACRLMLGKKHATTEPDMTGSNNFWAKNKVVIESRNYKAVGRLDIYIYIIYIYIYQQYIPYASEPAEIFGVNRL